METVLKAESLVKRYGDVLAVDNISFEINRGEIFGFLGPNGAGKTTTIKIMSGLLKPDSGQVTLDCNDSGSSIGICPQHIVVWENMTCHEQIVFMGRMYNIPDADVKRRTSEILEALGLSMVKDRLAKKLSGGMQRRLNIALAFIHSPEIVFLDEPQAGLDPQSRILVRDYIRSVKNKTTVVLTTHDMEEAEKLSDRICIIDKGRLLITGTGDELKRISGFEDVIEVDVSCNSVEFLSFLDHDLTSNVSVSGNLMSFCTGEPQKGLIEILEVVKNRNLKINSLRMRKTSLEDIFINLTGRSIRE